MRKWSCLLLSGVLIAFSFPTILFGWKLPNMGFLAWFGLVPLLILIKRASPKEAFRYGFYTATLFFLIAYYWIYNALHTFGNISPTLSLLATLLLSVVMAFYIGAAFFLSQWFQRKRGGEFLVWLPIFWTLLEWARNTTPFGGFPWSNLAMSQAGYLPLIQIADVTGVYGIIFLIVWVNVWLTELFFQWRGQSVVFLRQKTMATVLLITLVFGYGFYKLDSEKKQIARAKNLKVGLIQPNIPQEEKGDAANLERQKMIFDGAVQSLQSHVDLIIWPESSWTENLWLSTPRIDPRKIGIETALPKKPHTLLGLNFIHFEKGRERYFNSAALIGSDGVILARYHKVHLVPFGEYVPLKKLFFFLAPVATIGDFEAGQVLSPLSLQNIKLGPLICYEDIFPEISRAMVRKGAHLLINMTNDAWYGKTSAAYQHLALGVFRSIENRRVTIRATNTGVTAVIDTTGKVISQSPIFERGVLIHQIPLLTQPSTYTQLGDWFVLACFIFVLWHFLKPYVGMVKKG